MPDTASQPLYARVRATLVERIVQGAWAPGQSLPSEFDLADELAVSQGTVRKALDSLAKDHIVERRQGVGTFVVEQTPERALFNFFRMSRRGGDRVAPAPATEDVVEEAACAQAARMLDIKVGDPVSRIERTRLLDGAMAAVETMVVPAALAPGVAEAQPLPNALYTFYQSLHGVNVVRTEDRLRACGAPRRVADLLEVSEGAPLLLAERVAFDITDRPVEWRRSWFLTDAFDYAVTLRPGEV